MKYNRIDSFTCPSSNLLGRLRESYSFGIRSARYIKKHSSEIECIYINSWPLFSQYKIIKNAKKLNIPSALHIQDIYPESLTNKLPLILRKLITNILLPLDKYILRYADVIIGISPDMISYLSKTRNVSIQKFELVRNWQNDEKFKNNISETKIDNRRMTFMYVGSISASAGVSILIKSFHAARLPNARLLIAGSGSDKKNCVAIAERLQNNKIEFCEVAPEEVAELQSQADILLLPLRKGIAKTATPSKLTAYLLSGKPVIATVEDQSDVANILRTADCGFSVEPENQKSLTEVFEKSYAMNKLLLHQMGHNGKEYAELNLSKNANLSKITSIIEKLIDVDSEGD